MKKFFIAVALFAALGGGAVFSQTPAEPQTEVSAAAENTFKEITADELPQPVKDSVARQYEGQTIQAAFTNETDGVKIFKVTIAGTDGKATDVIFNENGEVMPEK